MIARIWGFGFAALIGLFPLGGGSHADGRQTEISPAQGLEIRQKAKAGQIRFGNCINDSVVDAGGQPMIVFHNDCETRVFVELCARRPVDPTPNYFFLIVTARSDNRFRLWFKNGQSFNYTYNTCGVPYCTPPDSDC